jgi:hypothetical protein
MRATPADIRRTSPRHSERLIIKAWEKYFEKECKMDYSGFEQIMNHYIGLGLYAKFDPLKDTSKNIRNTHELRCYYILQLYDTILEYPIFLASFPKLRACIEGKSVRFKAEIDRLGLLKEPDCSVFVSSLYKTIESVEEMCKYLYLMKEYTE